MHTYYMSNQTIIDAIDAAIEAWAGQPISMSINGQVTTYRSLTDLLAARTYYANLLRTTAGGQAFQLHRIKAGS